MQREDFPVYIQREVNWGDMDMLAHVNNVIYFRYFESARMEYLEEIIKRSNIEMHQFGTILANTSCDYLQPVQYPDKLHIGSKAIKVGNSSMQIDYGIFSEKLGLAAKGTSVLVAFDYKLNKPMAIPNTVRKAVNEIEGMEIAKLLEE